MTTVAARASLLTSRRPEPQNSDSDESSEESSEDLPQSNRQQPRPAVQRPVPAVLNNQISIPDKLAKIEQLLIKFNGSDKIPPLIESLNKNVKLLEGLKLRNLDELRHLEKLGKLEGLSSVYEGLDNLKFLKELERLNDLEHLDSLSKLEVFNDERINQLFVNIDQINSKLVDFTSHGLAATNDKLNAVNSKIDILNLALKPFRESNYANKMIELPNKLGVELARIAENNKITIKEDVISALEGIDKSIKDISNIELIRGLAGIKENLAMLAKSISQLENKDFTESLVLSLLEIKNLIIDGVKTPDMSPGLKNIDSKLTDIQGSLDSISKNNIQLSDLSMVEDNLSKKLAPLTKIKELELLMGSSSSSVVESVEQLKTQLLENHNTLIEKINTSTSDLNDVQQSNVDNFDNLSASIRSLEESIKNFGGLSVDNNKNGIDPEVLGTLITRLDSMDNKIQSVNNNDNSDINEVLITRLDSIDNKIQSVNNSDINEVLVYKLSLIDNKIQSLNNKDGSTPDEMVVLTKRMNDILNDISIRDELNRSNIDSINEKLNEMKAAELESDIALQLSGSNNSIKLEQLDKLSRLDELGKLDGLSRLDELSVITQQLDSIHSILEKGQDNSSENPINNDVIITHLTELKDLINNKITVPENNISELSKQLEVLGNLKELERLNELESLDHLSKLERLDELQGLQGLSQLDKLDTIIEMLQTNSNNEKDSSDPLKILDTKNIEIMIEGITRKLDDISPSNEGNILSAIESIKDKINPSNDSIERLENMINELNSKLEVQSNGENKADIPSELMNTLNQIQRKLDVEGTTKIPDNLMVILQSIQQKLDVEDTTKIPEDLVTMLNQMQQKMDVQSTSRLPDDLTVILQSIQQKLDTPSTSKIPDDLVTTLNQIISKLDTPSTSKIPDDLVTTLNLIISKLDTPSTTRLPEDLVITLNQIISKLDTPSTSKIPEDLITTLNLIISKLDTPSTSKIPDDLIVILQSIQQKLDTQSTPRLPEDLMIAITQIQQKLNSTINLPSDDLISMNAKLDQLILKSDSEVPSKISDDLILKLEEINQKINTKSSNNPDPEVLKTLSTSINSQLQAFQQSNITAVSNLHQKVSGMNTTLNDISTSNIILNKTLDNIKKTYDFTGVINNSLEDIKGKLMTNNSNGAQQQSNIQNQIKSLDDKLDKLNNSFVSMATFLNVLVEKINEKFK